LQRQRRFHRRRHHNNIIINIAVMMMIIIIIIRCPYTVLSDYRNVFFLLSLHLEKRVVTRIQINPVDIHNVIIAVRCQRYYYFASKSRRHTEGAICTQLISILIKRHYYNIITLNTVIMCVPASIFHVRLSATVIGFCTPTVYNMTTTGRYPYWTN